MTRQQVDAAVERDRARDETLGRFARSAASWLTADEGVGMLDQLSLQEFLWWHLPRKMPQPDWDALVRGATGVHRDVTWAVAERLYWWTVLGLVDEGRPRYVDGPRTGEFRTALNDAGEATVLAFRRRRSIRPRGSLRD